ncbi:Dyp-type peroxidase [Rothia sp. CCM 9419]|uniref:Dyp-type peroxidase n=1 Tax=Rothia sp. CCM 9419 TaxID=3402662 RepID=UPI003AEB0E18
MSDSEQTPAHISDKETRPAPTRRHLVAGALGAGIGALATETIHRMSPETHQETTKEQKVAPLQESRTSFYGARQAGIDTPAPAIGHFIAIDLNDDTDAQQLSRLLRILTDDAAQLTQGHAPIVDQEPELAETPASLTITFGFGEKIFEIANPRQKPPWLKPLPPFAQIDQLQERWSDGDLLIQICADDRMTVAHAQRMLLKDTRTFGTIRWVQEGFRHAYGSQKPGQTMRNLFGQVDGTVNPTTSDNSMEQVVWGKHPKTPAWEENGTSIVIRRIHMNIDTWDEADRIAREDAVGRKLSNGAPLTGEKEHDIPDLSATDHLGFNVIAPYAHIRRASPQEPQERILRRGYNYDLPVTDASGFSRHGETTGGISQSGLIFASYQSDPTQQFVPIQKRLAQLDMLNTWTVPIGSAVFAIPAGCQENGFIGENLFKPSQP